MLFHLALELKGTSESRELLLRLRSLVAACVIVVGIRTPSTSSTSAEGPRCLVLAVAVGLITAIFFRLAGDKHSPAPETQGGGFASIAFPFSLISSAFRE